MKKKRFYNNKRRNEKWTEQPVGRKIHFADKYTTDNDGENKYNKRQKTKKPLFTKENGEKLLKVAIKIVACIVIISIGYTIMDIHMDRHSMPLTGADNDNSATLSEIRLTIKGTDCQPLSLDANIMLGAVIDTTSENGYTSLAFDLKRSDGTIGYESKLATIAAFGAISSPSGDLAGSVKLLRDNDILPIGRISCYKDNIASASDLSSAVFNGGDIYTDSAGNTYLNPDTDSAYSYIRSIVDEAMGMGINVFVLDDYDLPDDISKEHADGFDSLADRLYNDFDNELKLYRAVNVNLTSKSAKSLAKEWKEKLSSADIKSEKTIICITAENTAMVKQFLDNRGITNYIISE